MKRKLKINKAFRGHKAEEIVAVECDENGTPLDQFWRKRVKDSAIDGCVEFVETKNNKKTR